jgi:ABC-type antimicrobial peptide transport system permease subunit
MALGADTSRIVWLVGREGLTTVVAGLGAGALVALALSRFVKALLFAIQANDLATYTGVGVVLLATSIIACLGPARRAIVADPARALRGG